MDVATEVAGIVFQISVLAVIAIAFSKALLFAQGADMQWRSRRDKREAKPLWSWSKRTERKVEPEPEIDPLGPVGPMPDRTPPRFPCPTCNGHRAVIYEGEQRGCWGCNGKGYRTARG